jgi:death on curing protein
VTIYPTLDEVISIHSTLIERFGGSHGIRDKGALESALARPRTGYYRDLIEEAAALWESLSQNHPFIDGNKRVSVTVSGAFLMANGYRLEFTDEVAFSFLIGLYETGRMRFDELDTWLRWNIVAG